MAIARDGDCLRFVSRLVRRTFPAIPQTVLDRSGLSTDEKLAILQLNVTGPPERWGSDFSLRHSRTVWRRARLTY